MSTQKRDDLTFETIPAALLEDLAELRSSYLNVARRYGDEQRDRTFVWAVMQEVLRPHLFSLLNDATAETAAIARNLRFVDRLVAHPDPDVRAVATVEILHPLATRRYSALRDRARPLMGRATLEALQDQEHLAAQRRRRMPLLERVMQLFRR